LQRVLSTVVLLGLLLATAAAFAITEHLKLVKSPIGGIRVSKFLAPGCRCENAKATIGFKLRHANSVTVRILDARNTTVATLVANRPEPKGPASFPWDGRTDLGRTAPDGKYWPEIALPHSKYLLPDAINLDTAPPLVRSVATAPPVIAPGTPGPANHLRIRYTLSERAHLILWHGSRRLLRTRSAQAVARTTWDGRTAHVPWRAGTYTLTVGAVDLAGNVTPPEERKEITVTVRYVALGRRVIRVKAGRRFAVGVAAAGPYTWRLGSRHGRSAGRLLHLRAPAQSGRYRLHVTASGHTATAVVVAR
jgi:hypothetical protein